MVPERIVPSQKSAIELMEKGVIHHIEGSMNGPLGDYCTQGRCAAWACCAPMAAATRQFKMEKSTSTLP